MRLPCRWAVWVINIYDIVQTEVRTTYNTKAYRILFACEGRFHHVLLALEGFQKKTQQTPKAAIKVAEQRLAGWRRRGKAKRAGQENEMNGQQESKKTQTCVREHIV